MNTEHLLILKTVILGIIEGLTEFLPISSTGHLILAGNSLGFTGEKAETFEIFIQLGAILAVVALYFRRFMNLLDFRSTSGFAGKNGLCKIALACAPAFVFGALFHKTIKAHLFFPLPVAYALLFGGIAMILIELRKKSPTTNSLEELSFKNAFVIGIFQCFALWPGISRSASTIVGALLQGVERKVAAEFSFLVAVPVMCAATLFDLLKSIDTLDSTDIKIFALGFVVSFVTAIIAIKFFLSLLNRYTLIPFGYYRIILAVIVMFSIL